MLIAVKHNGPEDMYMIYSFRHNTIIIRNGWKEKHREGVDIPAAPEDVEKDIRTSSAGSSPDDPKTLYLFRACRGAGFRRRRINLLLRAGLLFAAG